MGAEDDALLIDTDEVRRLLPNTIPHINANSIYTLNRHCGSFIPSSVGWIPPLDPISSGNRKAPAPQRGRTGKQGVSSIVSSA